MISEQNAKVIELIKKSDLRKAQNLNNLMDMCILVYQEDINELPYCLKITNFLKKHIPTLPPAEDTNAVFWRALKFESPHLFDSFCLYMERNREPKKRFYQPRRNVLKYVAQDLQDLEERKVEFYGLSLPPRCGKSTTCIFFLAWIIGRRPNSHSAMGGHSGQLAEGFYREVLNLTTSADYTFREIFPQSVLEHKSAERFQLNYDKPDRFATLSCQGVDGTWTGAIDISQDGYLYVDDMIRDRTESLSPRRLENRYQDYLNVMVDRKQDGARELMVGTRWNVLDVLGRVEQENKDNPLYRFRKISALNDKDESNFIYAYGLGFSTEYYRDLRNKLDKNEWQAKYQQKPFMREGLAFPSDELQYYNGVLPPQESIVKVYAPVDVAWGGGDSLSMPILYLCEDGKSYIHDWVFINADKTQTMPLVASKIIEHGIQKINFEGNNGGDMYADEIEKILAQAGYSCQITSSKAPTTQSKLAKIEQYSADIKRDFVFLNEKNRSPMYQNAMDELNMFTFIGKNEHDDSADSLAQACMMESKKIYASVEPVLIGRGRNRFITERGLMW